MPEEEDPLDKMTKGERPYLTQVPFERGCLAPSLEPLALESEHTPARLALTSAQLKAAIALYLTTHVLQVRPFTIKEVRVSTSGYNTPVDGQVEVVLL